MGLNHNNKLTGPVTPVSCNVPVLLARMLIMVHVPWPLQLLGHARRWHASPSNALKHVHLPVVRSQIPAALHSRTAWAAVVLVGTSAHAVPEGHTRCEQSGALYSATSEELPYPSKQAHVLMLSVQVPWPLHVPRSRHAVAALTSWLNDEGNKGV